MPSKGLTSRPASTAKARVTVNKELGSKFMFRGSVGEVVFCFPGELKLVEDEIVPSVIPKADTVDSMPVISRSAVQGLLKLTVTSLILLVIPVVDNTKNMVRDYKNILNHIIGLPSKDAVFKRLVVRPGSVTPISKVLKACAKDAIEVLPL